MTWQAENKYDSSLKIGAFIVSPIFGLLASLLRLNTRSSFVVLFAVFVTFGFSLVTRDERSDDFAFDSVAYRQWFEEACEDSPAEFATRFNNYIHLENHNMDFYCDLLNFLVSRFTNNYHFLFLVVASIFGYFKLKLLKLFVQEDNYRFSLVCFLLLFIFSINQIIEINPFRFYTALIISLYALFRLLIDGNKKYLLLLAITPFFHGSFFLMYAIVGVYYLVRNHLKLFFCVCAVIILPFIISPLLMAKFISDVIAFIAPDLARFALYTDAFYMAEINEGGVGLIWIARFLEHGAWLLVDAVVAFFALTYNKHIRDTKCVRLFQFLVLLTLFVNATIFIPSLGSRFLMMTFPILAYIYLVCYSTEKKYSVGVCCFALFYFVCMLVPGSIYQIPCLKFYTMLWEPSFWVMSPIYSMVRYLVLAVA